jgi:DNA-binding NtrC family response regulator
MDGSGNNLMPAQPQLHDVLIVEDERVSRRAMAYLLQTSGYHPAAYESAEDALRHLDGVRPPPVVLVDVDLPGMSGLDLLERLEKLRPDLKAVIISAADGERIEQFRRGHDVSYMRKPVDFPRLLEMLHRSPHRHHRDETVH